MNDPTPLELRRDEVAQYDANIAMYEAILATLPTEWPARLEQFKGRKDHHEAAAERVERTKAATILKVLEEQA